MITVTFNDYEEMMGFAKKLAGDANDSPGTIPERAGTAGAHRTS